MSESTNSFVVYTDIKEILDDLDDTQVATLFRTMVNYRLTGKAPKLTGSLKYIFIPIRQQMDRDAEKWESKRAARAESGRKGGLKSAEVRAKQKEANASNASFASSNEANQAVTVNATASVNDTVTVTTTTTDTVGSGGGSCDDEFNIWKRLTPDDIDILYEKFPNTGGLLIDEVYADVKAKKKKVRSGLNYILGYAKKVGWDDNADHFNAPWEAM